MSKEEKDEFDPISEEEFLELVFRSTRGSVRKRAGSQAKRNHRTEKKRLVK